MDTSPERFDRVASHPDFGAANDRTVAEPVGVAVAVAAPASFSVFAALVFFVGLAMVIGMGAPWLFVLAWAAFGIGAIALGTIGTTRAITFARAPIVRSIGVVIRDRSAISGGTDKVAASTHYYVTLQDRAGVRTEYGVQGDLAGRLVAGDIGLAFVKSKTLVDFVRFDV